MTIKKRVRSMLALLLAVVTLFSTFAMPAQAATIADGSKSVTIETKELNSFLKTTAGTSISGSGYNYTTNDEITGIGYCINWGLALTSKTLEITGRYASSPKTMGAFANGYPQRTLSQFMELYSADYPALIGLTDEEYIYATQVAIWATLGQLGVEGTTFPDGRVTIANPVEGSEQAIRVYTAATIILTQADSWSRVLYTGMYVSATEDTVDNAVELPYGMTLGEAARFGECGIEYATIGGTDYYVRQFSVASATSTWPNDYNIHVWAENAPSGTIFLDADNQLLTHSSYEGKSTYLVPTEYRATERNDNGSEFCGLCKIAIPVDSAGNSGSVTIRAAGTITQYDIYLAHNPTETEQSYIISDPGYGDLTNYATLAWGGEESGVGRVVVQKVDGTGNVLSGAEFTLTGSDGSYYTGVSNANGQIVWDGLNTSATYVLTETKAPAGYGLVDAQNVTVKANQTSYVMVKNTNEKQLIIKKVDAQNGYSLQGAVFAFEQVDGSFYTTATTGHDGTIQMSAKKLPLGSYKVYELSAPAGYEKDTSVQTVHWTATENITLHFENVRKPTLMLYKEDADTGDCLPGAVFEVYKDGKRITTVTTDEAGLTYVTGISEGYYEVKEIAAPEGYVVDSTPHGVYVDPYDPSSDDDPILIIPNSPKPSLQIVKFDVQTMRPVKGVTFQVYRDTVLVGTYVTDIAGEIYISGLEPGTYLVKEVAAGNGYVVNSTPQQIELTAGGEMGRLVFLNYIKPGIHLVKLDSETMEPLVNAKFLIKQVGGTFAKEYTTDASGEIDISTLEPGAYTVTELQAPDGYLIDAAVRTIQINAGENAQFVFTNTRKPSLTVVKYDPVADKYLPGAIFRIAKIEDGSHYLDRVTDTGGKFTITDLEPGVYSVRELSAPSGYVLNSHEYHVELFPGQESQVVVVNESKPDLRIIKTDADTGAPVSGVTFTVRYADGSTITTEATDENGEVFLEDMAPGVYEVWEQSVPDNYIIDPEHQHITLEPNKVGTVQFQNHQRPTLIINKVDLGGKALTGAIFELKTKAGVKIGDFPVDANGKVTISNVHLTEGYYIITEIQAPDGYILDSTPHEVYLRPGKTTEISIENEEKPDLLIQKIDSVVGDGIKGAKFELWVAKDKSTDGAYERLDSNYYYTDANGHIKLDDLDTGWYKIVEVEPASGYMLKEPSEQTVYVDNDKSATVVFENIPKSALIISKVDSDTGIGLSGAWFRVRYLGGTSGSGGTIIGEYQTSSNGNIILTGMEAGTYIIEEISAPDGYVIDTASQTAYISGNDQDVVTLTFTNSAKGGLLVKKVDSITGKPLSDVQFFVTDSDGSVIGSANGYFTTDINGTILISDITPSTTLVVKESRTRSGYVLDDTPQSIKIQSNAIMTLEFRNQPKGGLVVVKKDAVTGEPLSGVQFKITTASGELVADNEGATSTNGLYTTDEIGQIVLSNVMPDTYVVTETKALDGYILSSTPQTVVVNAGDTQTLTFTNQPYGGLLIKKMDSVTKEPLADVVFKVTTSDGSVVGSGNGLFRTDKNGYISIPGLEPDSYIVTEVQAKKGYLLDDTPRTIEVRDERTHTLEFFNQPLGSLIIHKLDSVTREPLEGVQFKITYADGKVVDAAGGQLSSNGLYWTDKNGKINISGITGTLVVTEVETVPGYTIHEESRSQTVVVNTNDAQRLYFYNDPIGGVEIIKVNKDDPSERIPNTTFEIRKVDDELIDTVTTDRRGRVFRALEDGAYYAVEIKAAEGFKLDSTPIYFEVENGKTVQLRVTNEAYSGILIHKTDAATGKGIYGVNFLLYDSGMNPIGQYTSDGRGYVYIEDIPSGRYYLRELETAEGYIADAQLKSIYVVDGTTTEVEWENTPVTGQIQIAKTSADYNSVNGWPAGTPIPNTVFEVYNARTGKLVDTIRTDKNGVAATKPLPLGRYTVMESKAADFYSLDKTPIGVEIEYAGHIVKAAMTNKSLYTNVSIKKTGYVEVMPGQSIRYDFSEIANTSTTALTSFYWRDTLPTNAVRLDKIVTGTYNVQGSYKIVYRTNLSGDSYRTLADNLSTMKNYVLDASPSVLGLASNEYITEYMVVFGVVPANFRQVESPKAYCNVVSWLTGDTQFVNQADVGGIYDGQWVMAATRWVTKVYKPAATLPRTGY